MRGIEASLQRIADQLQARTDEMVDAMLARMQTSIEAFGTPGPELADATRRSAYANISAAIASLSHAPPQGAPAEADQGARRAARLGVGLPDLLQTYRAGHAVAWEAVLDALDEHDLGLDEHRRVLRAASRHLFDYLDATLPLVTLAFTEERDALVRSGEHRRLRAVRELLAGTSHSADELGYDLRATHLAALAWGAAPEQVLKHLSRRLKRPALIVVADEQFVWAWLSGPAPSANDWATIKSVEAEATSTAFGTAASGLEGFQRSHREAQQAQRVAMLLSRPVTRFEDVAVEALALRDESAAREFVVRELAALLTDDTRSVVLRDTLRTYLETSSNASAAAATLAVSDRTVTYRLRAIEALLGYPLPSRSLELRLALRLEKTLREASPPA